MRPQPRTTINGGWEEMSFAGLRAANFREQLDLEQLGFEQLGLPIDFSTNGAPIRFGFMLSLDTAFRHEGGGFDTVSAIDDFRGNARGHISLFNNVRVG